MDVIKSVTSGVVTLSIGCAILGIPLFFRAYHSYDYYTNFCTTFWDTDDTFDFIIVGAGSAGAVLANRLSENFSVLVLEAGGVPNPLNSVPFLSPSLLKMPHADWSYYTVPQKNACLAMNSQKSFWPRGRSLGGSTNLNFLIYLRGHKKDYERWANVTGDARWNYENVLKMFKKSENYSGKWYNERFHSHDGYLHVSDPLYTGNINLYIKAVEEMGIPKKDLNADFIEGCSLNPTSQEGNGRRHDTYHAFILPVSSRKNLNIRKFSQVSKIVFEGPDNRAVGVEYFRYGHKKVAFASKEVILSAGTVNSPQILMLSGIGPKEHLESLQLPVLVNSPVGKNLQDHVSSFLGPFIINKQVGINADKDLNLSSIGEYVYNGTGFLTTMGCLASTFMVSPIAKTSGRTDWPDIHQMLLGQNVFHNMDSVYTEIFNMKAEILKKFLEQGKHKESFYIVNIAVHPFSRGEIKLESTDYTMSPLIDPKYFENELDLKVLVEGAKRAVDLVENAPTFKSLNATLLNNSFPGCEHVPFKSDAYWECYHRHFTLTLYHPVGTCAMGKRGSPEAVVDSNLRVIGTKNLRVIDASIMPFVTTANTNAPTIMIGEMGSEIIKEAWSKN